ncbi:MAG: GtrA family protein [Gammaproteobacteria bacterium]|nr:GtrA family protein [Gammaproteobacteria bacterium]
MRFVRYIVVQVATYALDIGVFLLLFAMAGWGAVASNVVAKILAGAFAFLAHRYVTFEVAMQGRVARQAALYSALWVLNVPLATGMLALLLMFGSPALIAKVVSDLVCVGLNYWLSGTYVFTGRLAPRVAEPTPSDRGPA